MANHAGRSMSEGFAERLDGLCRRRLGGPLNAASLVRLTAGASQQTRAFVAGGQPLILRRMPENQAVSSDVIGPETEAALIILAAENGVPEPAIRHVLQPADDLGRGFISQRVPGETLARRLLRDAEYADVRPKLAAMSGAAMAGIHAIDVARAPKLPVIYARGALDELLATYRTFGMRSAVFEAAFRWFYDHLPPQPDKPVLLHGDFRNGHLIVGPEGIRAVLDWELAHLGDPAQDLGWFCTNSWRFGARDKPAGGFGSVDDMLQGYAAAGGAPIDPARVSFWTALGSLRWGVMCGRMCRPAAGDLSVERAMIGRRISETELDLLDILAPDGRP